ncbi:MAG: hypothetical protein KF861_22910, partial [Planctomycetaceae bacterium]|nr:hypothetical protein [Planctomycetaceae bacterium]
YIGDEVTRILQAPSPEKREDLRKKYEKWASNQWIHHDGDAAHPHSPSGKGGMGRFASSLPMSFEPAPGDLPHPNSPSARTLDPLKFARFANGVAES